MVKINEIIKELQQDIKKYKKELVSKAMKKGIYENFGEQELRNINDKYSMFIYNYEFQELGGGERIINFRDWVETYEGIRK